MAEWLGRGLQNLLQRFESARDLSKKFRSGIGCYGIFNAACCHFPLACCQCTGIQYALLFTTDLFLLNVNQCLARFVQGQARFEKEGPGSLFYAAADLYRVNSVQCLGSKNQSFQAVRSSDKNT